jgi:hypothetical protein
LERTVIEDLHKSPVLLRCFARGDGTGERGCDDKKLISRLFLAVISIAQFGGKSEPTALAAGLEVGRFDLQTVSPMLMFLD